MKRIFFALVVLAVTACSADRAFDSWEMQNENGGKIYSVTVPCTVAGALLDHGVQPEKNMFDSPWVFRKKFRSQKGRYHVLRFHGLGYSSEISVNGTVIASADTNVGPFLVREYDVTPLLRNKNTVEVKVFKAPPQALNHGWVDWNPRPEDESMGITGPVELVTTPDVEIKDVFVRPFVDPDSLSRASIEIITTLVENPRARDPLSRSRLDPRGRGKRVKESRYKNDPCQKGSWQGIFL